MRQDIKLDKLGMGLLTANFHEHPWSEWSEEKTDQVLEQLEAGLQKLAQQLDLDLVDEEGYLI